MINHLDELETMLLQGARRFTSPEAQRAYLAGACGEDRELLEHMEALLRSEFVTEANEGSKAQSSEVNGQ